MCEVVTRTRVAAALHPGEILHLPVFLRDHGEPLVTQTFSIPILKDLPEYRFFLIGQSGLHVDVLSRRAKRSFIVDIPFPCDLSQDRRSNTFGSWVAYKQFLIKDDGGAFRHDLLHRLRSAKRRRQSHCGLMGFRIQPCPLDAELRLDTDRFF